ncbi:MAG: hypothetical protein WB586_25750 [Chthoniobacterales bacterium]|jgi:hypothetical protein
MKNTNWRLLLLVVIELAIYAAVVGVYVFLVVHFLGGWLKQLWVDRRDVYAFVAISLMIAQAIGLEGITGFVLSFLRRRRR